MGIRPDFESERRDLNLKSTPGIVRGITAAERMPDECEAELRDSFDGAKLCLTRQGELNLIGVVETPSGKVNLILATELIEGGDSVTYKLRLIAADTSRPGTAFRLDPDELCLVHRPTETRVFGKWNRQFHYLEFSDLRMRNEYIAVFTTAAGGVLAKSTLPGVPDGATDISHD